MAQTKGGPTPSAPGAAVYFVDIKDGATLPTKPTIHFGLRNMGVAPAGLDRENSGHHHLIIDMPTPPLDRPLPNDFNHLHFGAGQTEAAGDPDAGQAHPAADPRRQGSHPAQPAGDVGAHHRQRRGRRARRAGGDAAPLAGRRQRLFRQRAERVAHPAPDRHPLRSQQHGHRAGRRGKAQYRPPSPAGRYAAARARPAASRTTSITCISAPARPRRASRSIPARTRCSSCSPTRTMCRMIRR